MPTFLSLGQCNSGVVRRLTSALELDSQSGHVTYPDVAEQMPLKFYLKLSGLRSAEAELMRSKSVTVRAGHLQCKVPRGTHLSLMLLVGRSRLTVRHEDRRR